MSEDNQTEAATPSNVVTMQDNSVVDFGKRDNTKTDFDVEAGTVTFRVRTGETIVWQLPELEGLAGSIRKVAIYGYMERVKNFLSGKGVDKIAGIISQAIEDINAGKFEIRVIGSAGVVGLTDAMIAFAQARAEVPEKGVPHWEAVTDSSVIAEVREFYNGLTTAQKTTIASNPAVKMKRALIQIAKMDKEGVVVGGDLL